MDHAPTAEQLAIIEHARNNNANLLVSALAGSGKSWTLLAALKGIPQQSVLVTAFNKAIADHFSAQVQQLKLPRTMGVHVKTFHSTGLGVLKRHYPNLEVDKNAHEEIINRAAGAINFKMRRAALKLLRLVKDTFAQPSPPSADHTLALGYEYDIFTAKMNEREIGLTVEAVRDAYVISLNMAERKTIDFADMVWAPVALNLAPPSRYMAVIVDELQDISQPQMELIGKLMVPNKSRLIAVGDERQQIYQFRGSLGKRAWSIISEQVGNTIELPLTMTFRCSKAVVRAANRIVPALRPMPDAPEGSVTECKLGELHVKLPNSKSDGPPHTFVLSRNNYDLVDCALFLWQRRVAFQLNAGQELLIPIFDLLKNKLDTRDEAAFRSSLDSWFDTESKRAEKANATAYAEKIEEQKRMLLAALKYARPNAIAKLLEEIILPNRSGILCSTVHKVKGLEADRVYLLKQTFATHRERVFRDGDAFISVIGMADPDEKNLEYVGITRAREHLIWVDIEGEDAREPVENTFVMSDPLDAMSPEELMTRLQYVESIATKTENTQLAEAFMKHAREIETALERSP